MLTRHNQEILDYMNNHYDGKCAYNTSKKCDGLCNNCPYDLPNHDFSSYSPCGFISSSNYDYEDAILARQESYDF